MYIQVLFRFVQQLIVLSDLDGSPKPLKRGLPNVALQDHIPVIECSRENALFVDVLGREESRESLLLITMVDWFSG